MPKWKKFMVDYVHCTYTKMIILVTVFKKLIYGAETIPENCLSLRLINLHYYRKSQPYTLMPQNIALGDKVWAT